MIIFISEKFSIFDTTKILIELKEAKILCAKIRGSTFSWRHAFGRILGK